MKIALVHDYIKEYGGAERVLEALHELYPDAPVYTSLYLPDFLGPHKERFNPPAGGWDIRESWARFIPFREKLISPLRLLSPLLFRSFDFSEYDVVIVSATGAYFPNSIRCHPGAQAIGSLKDSIGRQGDLQNDRKGRNPVHITYCHTPPRYLYGYETAREWKKDPVLRIIGELINHFLRMVDFYSSRNVDFFIANSREVASRIKKFYRRESVVIYPPVSICHPELVSGSARKEMPKQVRHDKRSEYYLAGGRLARPKHIDLIVRTCREHKIPLKVFGKGFAGYEEELSSVIPDLIRNPKKILNQVQNDTRVEFLGEITDEEKYELMRNAKAYLFAATDEDFGITPVEAMAQGIPVVAYRGGGVLETVIEGKTGFFFDELTEESIISTIKKLQRLKIKPEDCRKRAEKFSKERFKTEIQLFVEKAVKNY